MKATDLRTLTLIAATAFLVGCGKSEAPIRPVVKQGIAPEKALKKIDPLDPPDPQKGGLSGN